MPSKDKLRRCSIVSHRGVHDNRKVLENTLEAFENSKRAGIWGVEFDLRWTKDLVPIVFHDKTLERLWGEPLEISRHTLSEIKNRFPLIPTLEEVVIRFGKKLHLMIEIKKENYSDVDYQNRVLKHIFKNLQPVKDFHLLSLNPEMFDLLKFVSSRTFLPVAVRNVGTFSRLALAKGYGGVSGHFLLMDNATVLRHQHKNQKVGTGFVESVNCLFRELNRGVNWVFSNKASALQSKIDRIAA